MATSESRQSTREVSTMTRRISWRRQKLKQAESTWLLVSCTTLVFSAHSTFNRLLRVYLDSTVSRENHIREAERRGVGLGVAGPHEAYFSNLESTQKYYTSFVALPFDRTNLKRSLISQAFLGPSCATEYGDCTTRV
ncbi:unnamed protein product [Calypogeia fissa]